MDTARTTIGKTIEKVETKTLKDVSAFETKQIPSDEKEFNKMIRRPFSKKMGKNLKLLDDLTSGEEKVREVYAEINGISDLTDVNLNSEELESFRNEMMEKVRAEIRREDSLREMVDATYTKCGIPGCVIHKVKDGEIETHLTPEEIWGAPSPIPEVEELLVSDFSYRNYVKVYPGVYVLHDGAGNVLKVCEY